MSSNLRLYTTIFNRMRQVFAQHRLTQVRNLSLIMTGLILARSVHLDRLSTHLPLPGQTPSLSNRLRRFLSNPRVVPRTWYAPVARDVLARFASAPITLILDTTQLGRHVRLLTVAVAYRRRALPLWFAVHRGKKGHVKVGHAIALLDQIRPWLPHDQVTVLGDGAFGEVELIAQLRQWRWGFALRLKGHYSVAAGAGFTRLMDLGLRPGQRRWLGPVELTKKHRLAGVNLALVWAAGEDEPWYLATSTPTLSRTLWLYRHRMWTEALYGDLKGHGFDLEKTRVQTVRRLTRLVWVVALSYLWLIALGSWVVKRGYRHRIDRRERRDKSYFRLGWDWLVRQLSLGRPIRLLFQPYL